MGRWKPNALERLVGAAMELFRERGFDETTAQDIAERAGLTERTFFRYFADKREVLFAGGSALEELVVGQLAGPADLAVPLDAVAFALAATAPFFEERREFAKARQALIAGHPGLRERELIKLASLTSAIAEQLRRRGVAEPAASLAAEAGMAIFKMAFVRWVNDGERRDLAHHIRESLGHLRAVTSGGKAGRLTPKKPRRAPAAGRSARR
ncbi:MAG: TetR family transcriptional regulator [Myxococcaceae bacterium]